MRHPFICSLPIAVLILASVAGPAPAAPPPNDDFSMAAVVTEPLPFNQQLSTVDATTAAGDPNCSGSGPTVWFSYTPSTSGWVDCNTFGSDYDTTLSVYTGTAGSLTQINCNDDSMGVQSRVVVQVTSGTRYYFMVGAYAGGPGGNLVFTVNTGVPPVVVDLAVLDSAVQPATGTASARLRVTAGEPVPLLFISANLIQRSGRGNIIAFSNMPLGELTDEFELALTLKDTFSAREHGAGFVGGPASIVVELVYEDPSLGIQFKRIEQPVKLKGGRGL